MATWCVWLPRAEAQSIALRVAQHNSRVFQDDLQLLQVNIRGEIAEMLGQGTGAGGVDGGDGPVTRVLVRQRH